MFSFTIIIKDNWAYFEGDYPLEQIRDLTSYAVAGAEHSKLYKKHIWDGRTSLYEKRLNRMPSGLVSNVVSSLKELNKDIKINIVDERENKAPTIGSHGFDLLGIDFGKGNYSYQLEAVEASIKNKRGILKCSVGSGKTEIMAAIIKHLSIPTLFLVTSLDLIYQTISRFSKRLGILESEIGIIGDSEFSIGKWITVATPQSLHNKLYELKDKLNFWQLLLLDEAHNASSDIFYDVVKFIPAYYRIASSATPLDRGDGANLKLIAQTGEIIYQINSRQLIDLGISVEPIIEIVKVSEPKLPKSWKWAKVQEEAIVKNDNYNNIVVDKVKEKVSQGRQCLVIVSLLEHGDTLYKMLRYEKIKVLYVNGQDSIESRQTALAALESKKINCIVVTSIWDQGIDTPAIDAIFFAGGGKSKIKSIQRIGRGMRLKSGKEKIYVVDFANFCHKYLARHSLERIETYKQEGFVIKFDNL